MKPWPAQPLLRLVELRLASSVDDFGPELKVSDVQIAAFLGVNPTLLPGWRNEGFSDAQADKYARRLELHPVEIWPGYDDVTADDAADLERMPELPRCAADDCDNPVVKPRTGRKLYCCLQCKSRQNQRRKYQGNEEFREAERIRNRAYYAECREALCAKQRIRDRAQSEERKEARKAYYRANRDKFLARQAAYRERRKAEKALRREALGPGWEEVA